MHVLEGALVLRVEAAPPRHSLINRKFRFLPDPAALVWWCFEFVQ